MFFLVTNIFFCFANAINMMNLMCVIIVIVGGLNWASIGFLQYDFIAGFFGTQANIFSRLVYICIGIACFYFIFMAFKYRGYIKIFDSRRPNDFYGNSKYEQKNSDNNQYSNYMNLSSQPNNSYFSGKNESFKPKNVKSEQSNNNDILS